MIIRLAACAALLVSPATWAADAPLRVSSGWVRLLPGNLPAGGYLVIENPTDHAVDVTGASSPDYGDAMIHRSDTSSGMGHMEMVDRISVPAHGRVALAPGGFHLMLMDPRHALKPGDTVTVVLTTSGGATVTAPLAVKPANATSAD